MEGLLKTLGRVFGIYPGKPVSFEGPAEVGESVSGTGIVIRVGEHRIPLPGKTGHEDYRSREREENAKTLLEQASGGNLIYVRERLTPEPMLERVSKHVPPSSYAVMADSTDYRGVIEVEGEPTYRFHVGERVSESVLSRID